MTSNVVVSSWPTSLDCLSWSEDNAIALAVGADIAIITQCKRDSTADDSVWEYTIIQVNAFTAAEVPRSRPLSLPNYSIGEELSLRHAQTLAWSAPGLGKYGRCVLAVLTSNHVLSIWERDGAVWKRSVILNRCLRSYYDSLQSQIDANTPVHEERKQIRQRIRAFAWCPHENPETTASNEPRASMQAPNSQYLAVGNDVGDILLLEVRSPYNILHGNNAEWDVNVVGCLNTATTSSSASLATAGTSDRSRRYPADKTIMPESLAWGQWKQSADGTSHDASLAYIRNSKLYCATVRSSSDNLESLEVIDVKRLLADHSDLKAPLRFAPSADYLLVCAPDLIHCIDFSADRTGDGGVTSHDLDGRWDEVSGLAFTQDGDGTSRVHITSHLSSSSTRTTNLTLPFDDATVSSAPAWQIALRQLKSAFREEYEGAFEVQERVWGIVGSPPGKYVATASSMLPLDIVAYVTPLLHRTSVTVSKQPPFEGLDALLSSAIDNAHTYDTNYILLELRQYLEQIDNPTTFEPIIRSKLEEKSQNQANDVHTSEPSRIENMNVPELIRHIRRELMTGHDLIQAKIMLIADIALGRPVKLGQISPQIVQRLLRVISSLPADALQCGEMSVKMLQLLNVLRDMFRTSHQHIDGTNGNGNFQEECVACNRQMTFESVKWARCTSGHQYSRCGLSFLSIQDPSQAKSCTLCGTLFLDEWKLSTFTGSSKPTGNVVTNAEPVLVYGHPTPAPTSSDQASSYTSYSSTEPPNSFARVMFAACDVCLYCGGKFASR